MVQRGGVDLTWGTEGWAVWAVEGHPREQRVQILEGQMATMKQAGSFGEQLGMVPLFRSPSVSRARHFILWSSCHPKVDLRVRKLMLREAGDSPKVT
jgi:hypothetical protein